MAIMSRVVVRLWQRRHVPAGRENLPQLLSYLLPAFGWQILPPIEFFLELLPLFWIKGPVYIVTTKNLCNRGNIKGGKPKVGNRSQKQAAGRQQTVDSSQGKPLSLYAVYLLLVAG